MKERKNKYYLVFKDLSYNETEGVKRIRSTNKRFKDILYQVAFLDKGRTYTTSYDNTFVLYDIFIHDIKGESVPIEHKGAKCLSIEELRKTLIAGVFSEAVIIDKQGIKRRKKYHSDRIELIIKIIKDIQELGELGTWQMYNETHHIREWYFIDKNFNYSLHVKPVKYKKNGILWVKELYMGEDHITYSGNIYPLNTYKILGNNLKLLNLKYFGWKVEDIREVSKNIFGTETH